MAEYTFYLFTKMMDGSDWKTFFFPCYITLKACSGQAIYNVSQQ